MAMRARPSPRRKNCNQRPGLRVKHPLVEEVRDMRGSPWNSGHHKWGRSLAFAGAVAILILAGVGSALA